MSKLNRSLRGFINPVDGVVNLEFFSLLSELKFVTQDLNGTVVGVKNRIGVLFLHNGGEVENLSLVESIFRTENEGSGIVIELKELGVLVLLSFHSFEIDLRLIVTIRILDRRQFIGEGLVQVKSESSLHLSSEIRMSVRQHIDVEVKL